MEKEEVPEVRDPRRARRGSKRLRLIAGSLLVAAIIASGITWWLHAQAIRASRLPDRIVRSVSFPLYMPNPLPGDFKADMAHASYDNPAGLVHVTLTDKADHVVTINEQIMPTDFSLDDIAATSNPIPGVGQGVITSVASGGTVATIISPDKRTLILLNTTTATKDELSHLAQALRLVPAARSY